MNKKEINSPILTAKFIAWVVLIALLIIGLMLRRYKML
jgi:hypothetical protein